MLHSDNVSMSVGHVDHVSTAYSSMENVTWKSPGPMCGKRGRQRCTATDQIDKIGILEQEDTDMHESGRRILPTQPHMGPVPTELNESFQHCYINCIDVNQERNKLLYVYVCSDIYLPSTVIDQSVYTIAGMQRKVPAASSCKSSTWKVQFLSSHSPTPTVAAIRWMPRVAAWPL